MNKTKEYSMKNSIKIVALLVLVLLLGGWTLPFRDAKANDVEKDAVKLTLTARDIEVKQNEEFDAFDLVVAGSYDSIDYPIVDTSKVGSQKLTFIAKKGLSEVKLTKVINIKDSVAPVIEGGDELITLKFDSQYDLTEAFEVTDNIDKDIKVTIDEETLNRTKHGDYQLVAVATDSSGNETTKTFNVHVQEDPEVIALRERNEAYKDLVAQADDLNNTLLVNTSSDEISNVLNRVNNAKAQESDYKDRLATLSEELTAKLSRAKNREEEAAALAQQRQTQQRQQTQTRQAQTVVAPANNGSIASIAVQYVGYPYVWGGASPAGFDCSGFVQYVYRQAGKSIPRMGMRYLGVGVSSPAPGDIVAYPGHVAIYIGNGQVVHALNPSQGVMITGMYATGTPIAFRRV